MATTNDFLAFATGGTANVLDQPTYAALAAIAAGYSSGVAQSNQVNKTLRQSSTIAAMIGQIIADYSGQSAMDNGNIATLESNFLVALRAVLRNQVVLADSGSANAYAAVNVPALSALPTATGYAVKISIASANTGASTFAPDGLAAKPIYGLGLQPIQGGELPAKGVATLLYVVASTVNSGNGAWIILECTGGAQQVAPATTSLHAVQFGQLTGLVGSVRNLKMSVVAAAASATLTADQIVVGTALNGLEYLLPSFNKTINLATTGAGGMDTGTAPVSGFVSIYAIWSPGTSTAALLACNATTSSSTIYSGANMPSGYTASALVCIWPTNASSQFIIGHQADRKLYIGPAGALNTSSQSATPVLLSLASVVPVSAKTVFGDFNIGASGAATNFLGGVQATSSGAIGQTGIAGNSAATGQSLAVGFNELPMVTAQTMYWTAQVGAGTMSFQINITGYTI